MKLQKIIGLVVFCVGLMGCGGTVTPLSKTLTDQSAFFVQNNCSDALQTDFSGNVLLMAFEGDNFATLAGGETIIAGTWKSVDEDTIEMTVEEVSVSFNVVVEGEAVVFSDPENSLVCPTFSESLPSGPPSASGGTTIPDEVQVDEETPTE